MDLRVIDGGVVECVVMERGESYYMGRKQEDACGVG